MALFADFWDDPLETISERVLDFLSWSEEELLADNRRRAAAGDFEGFIHITGLVDPKREAEELKLFLQEWEYRPPPPPVVATATTRGPWYQWGPAYTTGTVTVGGLASNYNDNDTASNFYFNEADLTPPRKGRRPRRPQVSNQFQPHQSKKRRNKQHCL